MRNNQMRDAHFEAEVERLTPSFEQMGRSIDTEDWYEALLMVPALLLRPLGRLLERQSEG